MKIIFTLLAVLYVGVTNACNNDVVIEGMQVTSKDLCNGNSCTDNWNCNSGYCSNPSPFGTCAAGGYSNVASKN